MKPMVQLAYGYILWCVRGVWQTEKHDNDGLDTLC
jgi:hypothetical protein